MKEFSELALELRSLAVFRGLLKNGALSGFLRMLEAESPSAFADACGGFAAELFQTGANWSRCLLDLAMEDENLYVVRYAQGEHLPSAVSVCLVRELDILERASRITSAELGKAAGCPVPLPVWETEALCFPAEYQKRMESVSSRGYGVFARYTSFLVEGGRLVPVRRPDPVTLSMLSGYEAERQKVIDNTAALLDGKPAANVLLYGDAGTGKSTTVKAAANLFAARGLRLIELQKEQLREIPRLVDLLGRNPLKFILFIDDLSFTREGDDFSALKAVLEGSVAAKAENIAIYATSNRRHLIRESFSERDGDDIHRGDTMQELVSLSDRFGLTVTFLRPDKKQYASIVAALARQYGIRMDAESLTAQADAYAIRRSGYSPRVAKQFVESLRAK